MMRYDTKAVRRQDRVMDEERAREILRQAEYGVMSIVSEDGLPYGVPVNFVWDGESSLYVHCAPEGRKLRALSHHPQVSFCVTGRINLQPDKFTTEYESVLLMGEAHLHLDEKERKRALRMILQKFSVDYMERGLFYAERSFPRTEVIRIDISEYSGKCKYMHPVGKKG